MKEYSEDDIVQLSDKLNLLLVHRSFNQLMLDIVGKLLEAIIYYIEHSK